MSCFALRHAGIASPSQPSPRSTPPCLTARPTRPTGPASTRAPTAAGASQALLEEEMRISPAKLVVDRGDQLLDRRPLALTPSLDAAA